MTTKQLRYFLELCKCASITKASLNHYVSRSSLVSSIDALEKELGQQLLYRSHSGIAPTDFGLVVMDAAQQILNIYDDLLEQASDVSQQLISISSSHLPFISVILSRCFVSSSEKIPFSYMEKRRCWVFRDVLDEHSEIGIISTPTESRDIVLHFFRQNALDFDIIKTDAPCCLVGKQNPVCQSGSNQISLRELASMYRILYRDTDPGDIGSSPRLPPIPLPCKGELYIGDRSGLHTLLEETESYSACASYPAEYDPPNIRSLKICDYPSTLDIIWFKKSRRTLNPLTRRFLSDLYSSLDASPAASLF